MTLSPYALCRHANSEQSARESCTLSGRHDVRRPSIFEYGSPPLMRTVSDGAQMMRPSGSGRPPLPRRRSTDDGDPTEVRAAAVHRHVG